MKNSDLIGAVLAVGMLVAAVGLLGLLLTMDTSNPSYPMKFGALFIGGTVLIAGALITFAIVDLREGKERTTSDPVTHEEIAKQERQFRETLDEGRKR